MDIDTEGEVLLTIDWHEAEAGWKATLVTATAEETHRRPLNPNDHVAFEITDERRCIGYVDDNGDHHFCPDTEPVSSDRQCPACRGRDAHRSYVEGRSGEARDGDHSVYLAQCGRTVKVGVTRSSRLLRRWVEQGALYAAEIERGISAEDALERELELSSEGLPERIQKHQKVPHTTDCRVSNAIDEYQVDGEVVDVMNQTVYDRVDAETVTRTGRVVGDISSVVGQLIALPTLCAAITPGKVIVPPKQTGFDDYL